jgi:DNA repair protein RecO (recombination protein O)
MVDHLDDPLIAGGFVVRFEVKVLDELGFGLDLERCAATGTNDDLAWVSPRTGRAVSRSAGEPYRDRLLPLPPFLTEPAALASGPAELADAFRLTAYFLARHVYEPRGLEPPDARASLAALVARLQDAAE